MVPSSENFSSCGSHSGSRECSGGFSLQGKNYLPAEWALNRRDFSDDLSFVFLLLWEIDLFVSVLNFRFPKYCSRSPDAQAWRIDALSFPWTGLRLYAFPPFSFLPRILDKLAQEGAVLLLVVPFWPQRPWFPRLLSLLVGLPRILPVQKDLVAQPPVFVPSSQDGKSSSFFMASFRQQGEETGLSRRAAQFCS